MRSIRGLPKLTRRVVSPAPPPLSLIVLHLQGSRPGLGQGAVLRQVRLDQERERVVLVVRFTETYVLVRLRERARQPVDRIDARAARRRLGEQELLHEAPQLGALVALVLVPQGPQEVQEAPAGPRATVLQRCCSSLTMPGQ